ncbi:hypothetical protein F4553_003493 [Allocatelliglobosispora scoriae]|uniref:Uncharacterized protein n=1 Tax=Allocatelliglobosispora scoriae TaxID=643052 RepID=A0A841BPB6_9ACTN|nr:hypothetical protein [Allocatelliglobosispora scoriae]MBB5870114.1 hypothetical protein [Allocatelliglobosispora scoriae]
MASNLECVGLAVPDREKFAELVESAIAAAEPVGTVDGVSVVRWTDPSGARLMIATVGRKVVDFLPTFAGTPGARLDGLRAANDEVATADVVDGSGELMTKLAVELEQRTFLAKARGPVSGEASIVALGVQVGVYASEEAFAASDDSLLSPGGSDREPPPHAVSSGMPWPPRMASESFISYGMFGSPDQAQAHARLNGTVLGASLRTVTATGQSFIVARVRTAGFEADLCMPAVAGAGVPEAGNVIGGEVFLAASMPSVVGPSGPTGKRSWLPWRRG